MNKYVNPSFDARQIDTLKAPVSYVPLDTRVPIAATRAKNLSRSTIGKKIRTIACKAIGDEIDDWRKKKPNATFCDALLKREPGLANQYGEWTECDVLSLKANNSLFTPGSTNFESMMSVYYGQFAIDPVSGAVSSDANGFNVVYPYLLAKRQLRNNRWQAYMYCAEGRPQCDHSVPLLRSNRKGFWELPDVTLASLEKKVLDKTRADKVEFEARIAIKDQYTLNFLDKYPMYLNNSDITRNNLHHLIADNVAKEVPMLRQAMFKCDWNVDAAENMIELAYKEEYLQNTTATAQGQMVEGNLPIKGQAGSIGQVGINFSPIVHSGPHVAFDDYVRELLTIISGSLSPIPSCNDIEDELIDLQMKLRATLLKGAFDVSSTKEIEIFANFIGGVTFPNSRKVSIYKLKAGIR